MKSCGTRGKYRGKYRGKCIMINVKFEGKKFKIYANGKIKAMDNCDDDLISRLQTITQDIRNMYNNPSNGFLVGFIADRLPDFGVEVINWRDYEMERSPDGRVY